MEFDDIFDRKERHHDHHKQNHHYDERNHHESSHSDVERNHVFDWSNALERFNYNKDLKRLVKVAFVFFVLLAVVLIIILTPYAIKVINYIIQNGLPDGLSGFIERFFKS